MRWSLPWRSVGGQQQRCAFTFAFDEGREFDLGHAHGIRVVPVEPLQEFCARPAPPIETSLSVASSAAAASSATDAPASRALP